jgi:hypothetical protein
MAILLQRLYATRRGKVQHVIDATVWTIVINAVQLKSNKCMYQLHESQLTLPLNVPFVLQRVRAYQKNFDLESNKQWEQSLRKAQHQKANGAHESETCKSTMLLETHGLRVRE